MRFLCIVWLFLESKVSDVKDDVKDAYEISKDKKSDALENGKDKVADFKENAKHSLENASKHKKIKLFLIYFFRGFCVWCIRWW